MSQLSNLFLSLGKPVKDEYGRSIGKIISFVTTPSGKFEAAFIELNNGRFTKQQMDYLSFNNAEVIFMSKIKSKASVFCDQIPFIWRKDQALKDLADKRKISPDLYQELHNNFNAILNQLRKDAQILHDEITPEIARTEEDLSALSYAILHIELEHEIGKIPEETYKASFASLQENLRKTTAEKADLETTKTRLANMLLGDPSAINIPTPQMPEKKTSVYVESISNDTSDLPEPPVVVYVKEVGKAGI
jgi:hypothetical protein